MKDFDAIIKWTINRSLHPQGLKSMTCVFRLIYFKAYPVTHWAYQCFLSVLQEVFVIVFLALLPRDVRLVQLLYIYADFFNSWFYVLERVLFSIHIFEYTRVVYFRNLQSSYIQTCCGPLSIHSIYAVRINPLTVLFLVDSCGLGTSPCRSSACVQELVPACKYQ